MAWFYATLFVATSIAWLSRELRLRVALRKAEATMTEIIAGKQKSHIRLEPSLDPLSRKLNFLNDEHANLRKQRQLAEANLQIILSTMQDGVLVADSRRAVRLVNPSLRKLMELPEDVFGKTVLNLLGEPEVDKMIADALADGTPKEMEIEVIRSGGIVLAISVDPMRDASGEPGALVRFRDVTRLTRLEHVRRDFVANVSHELRTPLAIFQGWVENLKDNPEMPREDQMVAFKVMEKHSHRLNALVEDLLTLARLEARREDLDRQPLDLPQFFAELARDWTTRTGSKNVKLRLDVAPDVTEISADRMRIEQVITNLLDNAFKYSPVGAEIVLGAKKTSGVVEIWVKDSGPGILGADLVHIFERFYRADKARSREHGGTGLGLSIVKHIVKAHGGQVSAESQFGNGTTIRVHLPVE